MRVAIVTHHKLPVRGYGGTQRVLVWLARGLRELGHEVLVVARAGSRVDGVPVVGASRREFEHLYGDPDYDPARLIPADADAVHFVQPVAARVSKPHLVMIQGNERGPLPPNSVFVSRDHMTRMAGRFFVYNGVDPAEYAFRAQKDAHYLFLGKVSRRVKGVSTAERVARRAGVRLVVAGGWRWRWGRRIRWVGSVGGARKAGLLAGARALLFPIEWEEPFGLVVVEAWISGTPVLASPRGSMPELVRPDVGCLCEGEDAFVEAVAALERGGLRYDPHACRAYALENFTHVRMAREYVTLYERAIEERWGCR